MANNQKKQGNTKQAPKLAFNGNKFNETKGFYQIPQEVADIIFKTFAKQPAYIRLMLVLIGTEPGFGLAEQWVLDRTGLNHASYNTTRNRLVDMGWLTCENGQVIVNYDKIYGRIDSIPQKNCIESIRQIGGIPENEEYSLNTPEQYSVNTSKEDLEYSVNTENSIESIPIIYKEIDNIDINKLEYITYTEISAIVGGVCWISEEIVQLPNGRYFRVKKEDKSVDWSSVF